jgi:hypothetical protein
MAELSIFNPVAEVRTAEKFTSATKLRDLNGKRVGLFWNGKAGGDMVLSRTAELLKQRYDGLIFKDYTGAENARKISPEQANTIASENDALIASTSD